MLRQIINTRMLARLAMLAVLLICLGIMLRGNPNPPRRSWVSRAKTIGTIQAPQIDVASQPGSPLMISEPRVLSIDAQSTEIGFKVNNRMNKTVRAYVIQQALDTGSAVVRSVSIYNLDLTNSQLLPNESLNNFEAYQMLCATRCHILLSVDYVDFAEGAGWGDDLSNSAERIVAQRAGARALSNRLKHVLQTTSVNKLLEDVEANAADVNPPNSQSEEWQDDFRKGCNSVVAQLKRAKERGGQSQVEREIKQLVERFKEN